MNIGTKDIKRRKSKMKITELKNLIANAYVEVLTERSAHAFKEEEDKQTMSLDEIPPALKKSIEKRYGISKWPDKDFVSSDKKTYFKTTSVDKTTGQVGHKPINLPSFEGMYKHFSNIIGDIKTLMNNKDVRTDKNARELFELIKTNFRKLQSYLRTERPDQYELMKMRRQLSELANKLTDYSKLIKEEKDSLLSQLEEAEEEPTPEKEPDIEAPEETVLEDSTDTILVKFPTLKAALTKLQTEDFKEFVTSIDWISPRPTSFRINLKNGQDYILKWTGKTFEAQILGKRYYINKIDDYQQALDKLTVLYQEAPMKGAGEDAASGEDVGDASTGGGEFPGDDGGATAGEEPVPDDGGADDGGEDLSGEPIDFEAGEEPEA